MLLVLHTILVGSTFHQSLIKIFQIVQESWKGQGRVMDLWVYELMIDGHMMSIFIITLQIAFRIRQTL